MPRSDGSLSKITPDPVYEMGLGWDGMGGEARPLAVSQVGAAAQERESSAGTRAWWPRGI